MGALVSFMFGVLLLCLGYLLYLLAQFFHLADIYQFVSFGFGVAGSLTVAASAAVSAWNLSSQRPRDKARPRPLSEALLYGVTGYGEAEEPVWRTKPLKPGSGLPRVLHMMCVSCNRPVRLGSKFCEFCGFEFRRGLDVGFRLESITPVFASCDSISENTEKVYNDGGQLFGLAAGRGDPFGNVLNVRTLNGETYECEVGRLLLIPLSSVPGEFRGSLIMMPQWFVEVNEALALAYTMKARVGGLLEELKNRKISEKDFENAYSVISSELVTRAGLKRIAKVESALLEQKAKLATIMGAKGENGANPVLEFELRTIESLLNQIRSSREDVRGAIRQIEEGVFSEKAKRLVSVIPNF